MSTEARKRHPVWPEGPDCDPGCPGSWSTWHDGYATGREVGQAEARRAALDGCRLVPAETLGRIADMTKPGSLYMNGTAAYPGSSHLTFRVHAVACEALGETATPWADVLPADAVPDVLDAAHARGYREGHRAARADAVERGTASGACPNHPYSGAVPHCAICGWSAQGTPADAVPDAEEYAIQRGIRKAEASLAYDTGFQDGLLHAAEVQRAADAAPDAERLREVVRAMRNPRYGSAFVVTPLERNAVLDEVLAALAAPTEEEPLKVNRPAGYPYGEMDAKKWTEEFFRIYPNGCSDFDTMLGWFANAIMTGYDKAKYTFIELDPDAE
jgi:hypothetical protein